MNRRGFLASMAAAVSAGGQNLPVREERVEKMVPAEADPAIGCSHIGFLPDARKTFVFRLSQGTAAPETFVLRDIAGHREPFSKTYSFHPGSDGLGRCVVGDFSEVKREGMYQISAGGERSVPFFIRPDLLRRTLPKAFSYHQAQRCGIAVPGVHPACHLDDARRRDNGEHIDVTGGWHDAGDLRKWMTATMTNAFGLMYLKRSLGDASGVSSATLLEEVRWGNRYFRKMQDPTDGQVWADAAGGVNSDNSDNHWTDNRDGTKDDRYINVTKNGLVQAMFVALQAVAAQEFRDHDPGYGRECLEAGLRCWKANQHSGDTTELGWWLLAAAELSKATGDPAHKSEAAALAGQLTARQVTEFLGGQKQIRGFLRAGDASTSPPYVDAVYSAIPLMALMETADLQGSEWARWCDAVRLYLDEYVLPLSAKSAYGIVPFGVFPGSPTQELYRPLAGELTYRFFMPVRKQFWWLGTTSHIELHGALLSRASKRFGDRKYLDLARRQLEWVMGANPFAACLMTAEGMRNVYPHSRFVGLLPGGIVNGIAGNAKDEPVLDTKYGYDWRTTEYWSPHNAWYLWAMAMFESA